MSCSGADLCLLDLSCSPRSLVVRRSLATLTDSSCSEASQSGARRRPQHPFRTIVHPPGGSSSGTIRLLPAEQRHRGAGGTAAALERAERSIDAQYYLLHADLAGYVFVDQLLKAADRGVRVRLLLDDMTTKGHDVGLAVLDSIRTSRCASSTPSHAARPGGGTCDRPGPRQPSHA